jgi:glycerol uptake facilitator-like aquaporin
MIAVPVFVGSTLSLILFLMRGDYVATLIVTVLAFVAMISQAKGHAREANPPAPFSGPGNFLRRWFTEQFVTFPLFFLTGRWWRQFKNNSGGSDDAA